MVLGGDGESHHGVAYVDGVADDPYVGFLIDCQQKRSQPIL